MALCKAPFARKLSQTVSSARTFKERTKLYLNKEILSSKKDDELPVRAKLSVRLLFCLR